VDLNLKQGDIRNAREFVRHWARIKSKQPQRSAGCIFKNLSAQEQVDLDLPSLSTGYIIDKVLKLKGKRKGDAIISTHHAAFIENLGSAKAADVFYLLNLIRETAQKKLGLDLKQEVELIGDFS
jgi:UDP-N-acetylmuramate dehydrogenase